MDQSLLHNIDVYVNKTIPFCFSCLNTENDTKIHNLNTFSTCFTQFICNTYCVKELHGANICVWCARKVHNTLKFIENLKNARNLLSQLAAHHCTSTENIREIVTEINNLKHQTIPQIFHFNGGKQSSLGCDTWKDVKSEIKTEADCDSEVDDVFVPFETQEEIPTYDVTHEKNELTDATILTHVNNRKYVPEIVKDSEFDKSGVDSVVGEKIWVEDPLNTLKKTTVKSKNLEERKIPTLPKKGIKYSKDKIDQKDINVEDLELTHSSELSNPLLTMDDITESCDLTVRKGRRKRANMDRYKHKKKRKNGIWTEVDCHIKKEFITEEQRKREMEMRSRDPAFVRAPYACAQCVLPFNFNETYRNHVEKHKLNELRTSRTQMYRYACMECGTRRSDRDGARRHYIEKHASDRMLPCTMCNRTFAKEFILRNHILRFHSDGENTIGMFVCAECGKCLKYKQTLRNHMMTHEKDRDKNDEVKKYLECSHCAKRFHAKGTLVKHLKTHNDARNFYCDICKASFKSAPILTVHTKRKHSSPDTYKYECSYCQKRFLVRGELKYHINGTHLKQGVPCMHCDKSFRNAFKMRKHIQIVHEKRPEPRNKLCQYCGKGFTEENRLKRHLLVHTGERPFACNICAATFNQKSTMKVHVKRAHSDRERTKEKGTKSKKLKQHKVSEVADSQVKSGDMQIRERER